MQVQLNTFEITGSVPIVSEELRRRVCSAWNNGNMLFSFDPVLAGTSQCQLFALRIGRLRCSRRQFNELNQRDQDFLCACFLLSNVGKILKPTGTDAKHAKNFLARETIRLIFLWIKDLNPKDFVLGGFKCDKRSLKEELLRLAKNREKFFARRKPGDNGRQLLELFPTLPSIVLFLSLLKQTELEQTELEQTDFPVGLLLKLPDDTVLSFVKDVDGRIVEVDNLADEVNGVPMVLILAKAKNPGLVIKKLGKTSFDDFQLRMAANRMRQCEMVRFEPILVAQRLGILEGVLEQFVTSGEGESEDGAAGASEARDPHAPPAIWNTLEVIHILFLSPDELDELINGWLDHTIIV